MLQPTLAITRCVAAVFALAICATCSADTISAGRNRAPAADHAVTTPPALPRTNAQIPAPSPLAGPSPVPTSIDPRAPFNVGGGKGPLLVLVRHSGPANVELLTPAGQALNKKNIWRVGRWYADDDVDVITVEAPAEGAWQLVGEGLAGARLFVARDLTLVATDAPAFIPSDRSRQLRWQLRVHGQPVDGSMLADLLVAHVHIHSGTMEQDLPVERGPLGTLLVTMPALSPEDYVVTVEGWVKIFALRGRHEFEVGEPPSIRYERRGPDTVLWVRGGIAGVDAPQLGLVVTVQGPDQRIRYLMGSQLKDGSFRVFVSGTDWRGMAGDLNIKLELQGHTRTGQVSRAPPQVVTFSNGAPTLEAPGMREPSAVGVSTAPELGTMLPLGPDMSRETVRSNKAAHQAARHSSRRGATDTNSAAPAPLAGPGPWYLGALLAANLGLAGLLIWRVRRTGAIKVSNGVEADAAAPATAVTEATRHVDVAAEAPQPSPAAMVALDESARSQHSESPAELPAMPEEISLDDAALADFAAMAATQADFRASAPALAE